MNKDIDKKTKIMLKIFLEAIHSIQSKNSQEKDDDHTPETRDAYFAFC